MATAHSQTIARLWRSDREGTEDYTRVHIPLSVAPETAIASALGELASTIGALSDAALSAVETEFFFVDDGPVPAGAIDLSSCGSLLFSCEVPDDQLIITIPALLASCYQADGVTIDPANLAIAGLVAELLAPGEATVCNLASSAVLSYETGMRRIIPVEFAEATG